MSMLQIDARFANFFLDLGLTKPEDFLNLSGVVQSGHPNRHVLQLKLGHGSQTRTVYLKKEHVVPRKDRWNNFWEGFGFISKSTREYEVLQQLRKLDIGCPQPMAVGEDEQGRAFLLLESWEKSISLPRFLRNACRWEKYRVLWHLGRAIARMHNAGCNHPDLYSKHILVHSETNSFCFLDWQRSRHKFDVSWDCRSRDLAALHATVSEESADAKARLLLLDGYLQQCQEELPEKEIPSRPIFAKQIEAKAEKLLRRRRIVELRKDVDVQADQQLIWVDGERLCLRKKFYDQIGGKTPQVLHDLSALSPAPGWSRLDWRDIQGQLYFARKSVKSMGAWQGWKSVTAISQDVKIAGLIFRLQRFGVKTPELLAMGHRKVGQLVEECFVLVKPMSGAVPLQCWRDRPGRKLPSEQIGQMLRQIHDSGNLLGKDADICVLDSDKEVQVGMFSVNGMSENRKDGTGRKQDFLHLWDRFGQSCARRDHLMMLRGYFGDATPAPVLKNWIKKLRQLRIKERMRLPRRLERLSA